MKEKPATSKATSKAKPPGGGGGPEASPALPVLDSDAEKISQRATGGEDSPASNTSEPEAGRWLLDQLRRWDMPPSHYYQLNAFPNNPDDWREQMEQLQVSALDDEGQFFPLMHSIEWTMLQLWKWLHLLAEHASNPNFKRDAGRLLGTLYNEARLRRGPAERLKDANEAFSIALTPHKGPAPASWLVRWIGHQYWRQREFWFAAAEVASRYDRLKRAAEERKERERLGAPEPTWGYSYLKPGVTLQGFWKYWLAEEDRLHHPPKSEWLEELQCHPFCQNALTIYQLKEFKECWNRGLAPALEAFWNDPETAPLHGQARKNASFGNKFSATEPVGPGFRLIEDRWHRQWVRELLARQEQERRLEESLRASFSSEADLVRAFVEGSEGSPSTPLSSAG